MYHPLDPIYYNCGQVPVGTSSVLPTPPPLVYDSSKWPGRVPLQSQLSHVPSSYDLDYLETSIGGVWRTHTFTYPWIPILISNYLSYADISILIADSEPPANSTQENYHKFMFLMEIHWLRVSLLKPHSPCVDWPFKWTFGPLRLILLRTQSVSNKWLFGTNTYVTQFQIPTDLRSIFPLYRDQDSNKLLLWL